MRYELTDYEWAVETFVSSEIGSMLLADRAYDADWIRAFATEKGSWANVPPRSNRREPICFSPHLYRARNLIDRSELPRVHPTRVNKVMAARFMSSRPSQRL